METRATPEFLQLQAAVAGRYSLEREVGRGGMGIVFLAHDVRLERPVAIKLLAPELAARAEMRRRFLREARIAAQCFHPHIVPIHAVEEIDDIAFYVMSYVRGETLASRIARTGPLPVSFIERIAREMAWALAYAHERGVVHRDIKPENILIEEGSDRCLLTDFGIARLDETQRTPSTGEVAGTALYMAPEQAMGEDVDGRADLYALGVTLFVAASGRHPFPLIASPMAMAVQHATTPAPPIQEFVPELPLHLAEVIDRCLAKRAVDRFPDASALLNALDASQQPPPLLPALQNVSDSARAVESLAGWTIAVGATTVFLLIGEYASPMGRAFAQGMGQIAAVGLGAFAALRAGEAIFAARRALKQGTAVRDVLRALAGETQAVTSSERQAGRAAAKIGAGLLLALAQGTATSINGAPVTVDVAMALLTVLLPPFLIVRGMSDTLRGSKVSAWLRAHVSTPLARGAMRLLGVSAPPSESLTKLPNAPTEVRLDNDAIALYEGLAPEVRANLSEVPVAVNALVRDADALRKADRALVEAERIARAEGVTDPDSRLQELAEQRAQVQARLTASIAALETIRLDLMRLAAGAMDASHLTTHLDVVYDIERHIEADEEIRALLRT